VKISCILGTAGGGRGRDGGERISRGKDGERNYCGDCLGRGNAGAPTKIRGRGGDPTGILSRMRKASRLGALVGVIFQETAL